MAHTDIKRPASEKLQNFNSIEERILAFLSEAGARKVKEARSWSYFHFGLSGRFKLLHRIKYLHKTTKTLVLDICVFFLFLFFFVSSQKDIFFISSEYLDREREVKVKG